MKAWALLTPWLPPPKSMPMYKQQLNQHVAACFGQESGINISNINFVDQKFLGSGFCNIKMNDCCSRRITFWQNCRWFCQALCCYDIEWLNKL